VLAPQVQTDVPSVTGSTVRLRAGAENSSQGTEVDQDVIEITDNFTMPVGRHRLTVGTKNEIYRIRNLFAQNSYGVWEFSSLDSLANGTASRYQAGVGLGGPIDARFDAAQLGAVRSGSVAGERPVRRDGGASPRRAAHLRRASGESIGVRDVWAAHRPGFRRGTCSGRHASASTGTAPAIAATKCGAGLGVFVGRPAFVWIATRSRTRAPVSPS
jgi:hypothetical protein